MSPTLIIGILMAGGGGDGQASEAAALLAAVTAALGPGVSVVVEYMPAPSEQDALRFEKVAHATAVAAIWEEASGGAGGASSRGTRAARVRVHVAAAASAGTSAAAVSPDGTWRAAHLTFLPGDSSFERGRTIGLTVAAMIQSSGVPLGTAQDAEIATRARTPTPAPPATGSASPALPEAPGSTEDARLALEFDGIGAMGVGGPAGGLGAAVHLERARPSADRVGGGLWWRVGGGFRAGPVDAANGDDRVAWATVGGAWRLPGQPRVARDSGHPAKNPLGIAITLDVGAVLHVLSHRQAAGPAIWQSRALPEASLGFAGTWRLGDSWEAQAGLGVEVAFGKTEVWVAQIPVTTIPVVRGLATLGVRFGW